MVELYLGLGITLLILYFVWNEYKDDFEDFFKY